MLTFFDAKRELNPLIVVQGRRRSLRRWARTRWRHRGGQEEVGGVEVDAEPLFDVDAVDAISVDVRDAVSDVAGALVNNVV